ncbi:PREDICTED: protein SIEVE ELEMENT OCCLUSION B-like [Prunus mume]|uniref:Protein SIEVE ELEMENT OCCLUSION B-like n=1 Tax=Prunus mume TaxID=102107 RepID=A0ABM0NGJ5_PRUMU|nr:PREDICTED: protein SIEVE ELEMENT OCCLUSION B-like [Prunus mume]
MVVITFKKPGSQVDSKNGVENIEAADTKSLFSMTDTEILEGIYATHVVSHEHDRFDVHSLFSITESILKCSKQIVDNIEQKVPRVHAETMEGITITPGFSTPLCVLKSIVREVPCKAPGEKNAHDATLKILSKVSKYSWEAKAVLALAAFSLEYGEFWLSAQHQQSDQLAMSVAFLKGVPILLKPENLKKRGRAITDLNNVIMSTLQVIDCIFQLEKHSTYNDVKELREILANARKDISVNVYWCIITTVACATNITLLTSDEGNSQDLVQYAQKITIILSKLKQQLKICEEEIEKLQAYMKLKQLFQIPTEIMEVMKILIFFKHNVETTIFDGSTKKLVNIDILKTKNVLLFISSLEISEDYIARLKPIYDFTKENNEYKIVWIPIVEKWTEDLQPKFEALRAKMPWYTVGQADAHIAGIKYIKEDWNFNGKPMLVVLNTKSQLQHLNALRMIWIWGCQAFPFTQEKEEQLLLSLQDTWFSAIMDGIDTQISKWNKDDYIFFYGGDSVWMNKFKERATTLKNDAIKKEPKISIELYPVEKNANNDGGDDGFSTFWSAIESMFHIKVINKQIDDVVKQVQKLLSYKDDKSGWAVLIQGRRLVAIGGSTMYTVLEQYHTWNQQVTITIQNFGQVFNEKHKAEVEKTGHVCSCFSIAGATGSTLEAMVCYECGNVMEAFFSYKCCHVKKN